jgi:hypothetical protein
MVRYPVFALLVFLSGSVLADSLSSWNDGPAKEQIVAFVDRVTDPESPGFVPVAERIAVFDNDGTLWSEKPVYFQLLYAIDFIKDRVDEHPDWLDKQPFKAVLDDDTEALAAQGEEGLVRLLMASHAGTTSDEFDASVRDFLATSKHPGKNRPYTELVYQPMLELLEYFRDNDFQTWIVSGGGSDFIRTFSEDVYGIPPEQVVGSSIELEFEMHAGTPALVRKPAIDFIDDKAGKPVGIHRHIGRRPIVAFGNSDGDHQMLQWTAAGDGPRLMGLVHHTDDEREWAYDRDSHVGRLDAALKQAREDNWVVVDMARDWASVYPFERDANEVE